MIEAGCILAGGQGRRLGDVRKATLRIGNRPLLARVAERLRPQIQDLAISIGGHEPSFFEGLADAPLVSDPPGNPAGPAAGLIAVAQAFAERGLTEGLLLAVPVDAPDLPQTFGQTLLGSLTAKADVAIAVFDGQIYPTHALWRLEALNRIAKAGPDAWAGQSLRRLGAQAVHVDFAGGGAANPFAGINVAADLVRWAGAE